MAKFQKFMRSLPSKAKKLKNYGVTHWNKAADGEYLSLKEVTSYGMGQVGGFVYSTVIGIMVFGSTYFCGAIMKISNLDFYKITMIGTILGYALTFLNPLGVLIYENHGKLQKKTKIFALIAYSCQLVLGVLCYFLPISMFENIPTVGMIAFPQILGNILVCGAIGNFVTWFVRSKFCAKYGRLKPFILLFGIPSAILMSMIPFLGLENMPYATRLIVLHLSFTLMSYFLNQHNAIGSMVTFMTPNSQERQRLYSFVPIITSLIPSIICMFFPILIQLTGGYQEIATYKVFVPIFSALGVAISFFAVNCKERIIEKTDDERIKVTFWKGAKNVLRNKYLWIINLSNIFALWSLLYGSILQSWFVYSVRIEWFYGFAANIVVLSMTAGNLLTPLLTRKFEKKNIMIACRIIAIGTILLMLLSIKMSSVVLFMFAMFLRNGITPIESGVYSGIGADVMDYHQWKFGERADNMSSIFSWFLSPITLVLGYVIPFLQRINGFNSDWDIMYNSVVINNLFTIYILFSIVSTILSTIPLFFYGLTREKHAVCIHELKLRVQGHTDNQDFILPDHIAESATAVEDGLGGQL